MRSQTMAAIVMVAALVPAMAGAVGECPPRLDGARVETSKTVDDTPLKLWIFAPPAGPPTIIVHGDADETVPIATAEAFAALMRKAGNRCELVASNGRPHGFFNREPWRSQTLREPEAFLDSLGWIPAVAPASVR